MRPLILAAPAVMALALAACASTTAEGRYAEELRELRESCLARGGILTPTGQHSGQPPTDYVCHITGGASRLQRED